MTRPPRAYAARGGCVWEDASVREEGRGGRRRRAAEARGARRERSESLCEKGTRARAGAISLFPKKKTRKDFSQTPSSHCYSVPASSHRALRAHGAHPLTFARAAKRGSSSHARAPRRRRRCARTNAVRRGTHRERVHVAVAPQARVRFFAAATASQRSLWHLSMSVVRALAREQAISRER